MEKPIRLVRIPNATPARRRRQLAPLFGIKVYVRHNAYKAGVEHDRTMCGLMPACVRDSSSDRPRFASAPPKQIGVTNS